MSWKKIVAYRGEYTPGSMGVIYFKCEGDVGGRRTPPLEPAAFTALLAVLNTGAPAFEPNTTKFCGAWGTDIKTIADAGDNDSNELNQFEIIDLPVQKF